MANQAESPTEQIVQNPAILGGKPVVRGTRIPVEAVLGRLVCEPTLDEVFAAYPELTVEEVKAALAFALHSVEGDFRRSRRRFAAAAKA